MQSKSTYRSYLLRLRRVKSRNVEEDEWRISLQEAGKPQEIFLATLDALLIYLTAQIQIDTAIDHEPTNLRD